MEAGIIAPRIPLFTRIFSRGKKLYQLTLIAFFSSLSTEVLAIPHQIAVLQTLDKVTARVSTVRVSVGELLNVGTLQIVAQYCDKRPPEEPPETVAFLDIWERRVGQLPTSIFRGWMFASSPGLIALEHPVYDVWVLDCDDPIEKNSGLLLPDRQNKRIGYPATKKLGFAQLLNWLASNRPYTS